MSNPAVARKIAESQRRARELTCKRCGATVLFGPDHDRVSMMVTVDPRPVSEFGEKIAIQQKRQTFDIISGALYHRDPHHRPGSPSRYPVHVEHICGDR